MIVYQCPLFSVSTRLFGRVSVTDALSGNTIIPKDGAKRQLKFVWAKINKANGYSFQVKKAAVNILLHEFGCLVLDALDGDGIHLFYQPVPTAADRFLKQARLEFLFPDA